MEEIMSLNTKKDNSNAVCFKGFWMAFYEGFAKCMRECV